MSLVLTYIAGVVTVALLDVIWLGFVMKEFYFSRLGHLFAESFNLYAAGAFYVMYMLGIMYFAVVPNAAKGMFAVAIAAAILGSFAYATYDLTNMATLSKWPLSVTLIDILWGAALSATSAAAAYAVGKALGAF